MLQQVITHFVSEINVGLTQSSSFYYNSETCLSVTNKYGLIVVGTLELCHTEEKNLMFSISDFGQADNT